MLTRSAGDFQNGAGFGHELRKTFGNRLAIALGSRRVAFQPLPAVGGIMACIAAITTSV
ncbi:hypothetical protein GCM10010990_16360 [Croceicoccus mobilis]|uniref:Uncharacterized protein n=1 Tax=Croceicoccus mobilis TaxID=1703339 RepID=A0A916YYN7_9SPHN|nr:hypothetical protein GCM10010990_16360 [Croceicoccus mobilis]